ncbi:RagB/SusD family nutrient uptake outer membrane protein [Chitinophaga sp. SYP-B3965]|uniref:RagB/SusD family nutrient uptake outer membrane protein n=1 Tax=Chitinophaga sp. SYP-B3965 TaxID=2663120 RepID=UPI001299F77D|nr:RagB/SusD family nutrient uptake outer membrane protein [Chitinophaga sp. SYP-B3965]MRG46895.1 RagB/SusD family nutrient uptake outer membrane protein [Chitinophaga sp. SYP-B3965]
MKNLHLLYIVACSLLFTACDESLDIEPTDQLTDASVWKTPTNAGLFLNDIYNSLNPGPQSTVFTNVPSEVSNDPLDNFSDNSLSGPIAGIPSYVNFAQGSYGPSTPIFTPHWKNMYTNIRKCNVFIANVTASSFDDATKKGMLAQAKFLRAYYYKSLMDIYGGVPIITIPLNREEQGEAIFNARNTYEECVAFIQKECDEAAVDLPLTVAAKDAGRATKGAAWALKGEQELYAGKWPEAAATNLKIMQSGAGYDLFGDYGQLFLLANENNKEVIFDIQYAANVKGEIKEKYWNPVKVSDGGGWGAVNPTQDLVDEYEFLDGKTEAEGSTLFDPENPYKNRDKRFEATIIYDGATWKNGIIYTRLGVPNNSNELDASGAGGKGRTGYFLKKMVDPSIIPGNSAGANSIIWRYAEVLLNYAEAQNEAVGPDQSVYDAMKKVRVRAGLPELPANLTQAEMRIRIRRERRIEMAFEGKRLFDLWRWRTAEQIFGKNLRAMKITVVGGKPVYEKVNAGGGKIAFDASKNYLMPIPQTVIAQNPKILQNPKY